MRKYGKRLLSFVLTLAMIVGMVNMPAKAAEVTTNVTVEGLALDGDYLYPRYVKEWESWYVYFNTNVDIPASGDVTLTLQNGKEKFQAQACRGGDSGASLKWLLVRISNQYLPMDGDTTITVKEQILTFSNGANMKLHAFSFNLSGGVWSMAGRKVMPQVTYKAQLKLGTHWDHDKVSDSGVFYLYSDDNNMYKVPQDQNEPMTRIDVDDNKTVYYGSRVWKWTKDSEGKYKTVAYSNNTVIHFASQTYQVATGEVSDGDIYQFQGYYKDIDGNTYGFFPVRVKYENNTWTEITDEIFEKYDGSLSVNQADWAMNADTATSVHLKGSDAYLAGCQEKWSTNIAYLEAVDGTITVDGQPADLAEFQKDSGVGNNYYLRFNSAISNNAVVKINGTFKAKGAKATVTFHESQFKWDGLKWIDVPVHAGKLLTTNASGAQVDSDRNTGLYMKGFDSYMAGRTYQDWDAQDIKMKAADENSGVFVDGVRKADAEIWKYDVPENWYYLYGEDISTASKVVIKGNFKTLEGRYAVSIEESTFTWDGSKWVNAVSEITIDKLALDRDYLRPKENAEWPIWQFHFYGNVDVGTTKTYFVSVEIDGVEYGTVLTDSPDPGLDKILYSKLEKEWLNMKEGSKVTYKAGKYFADDGSEDFITLKNDYTFYVNQYGWSTESLEAVTPSYPTQEKIKLDVTTPGTADGFYITTNIDDGRTPDATNWQSRIHFNAVVDPYATYYSGGAWKQASGTTNKTQRTVTLPLAKLKSNQYYVALSDFDGGSASAGDTYTIGGFFKDEGTDVTYGLSTLTVQWDGASWKQISTSLDDTGVKYDVNGDYKSKPTSKDLVALLNYNADTDYPINIAQADIYVDSKYNKEDVIKLRKIIVGLYDAEGNYIGAPDYSADRTFEKMAYVCPDIGIWNYDAAKKARESFVEPFGSWNDEKTVFTPNDQLKNEMQQYKDAGFTLINTEKVGGYEIHATDGETGVPSFDFNASENEPLKIYLQVAEQYDLGVLVFDVGIFYYLDQNKLYDGWQDALDRRIAEMKAYSPAFKGLILSDEIAPESYSVYSQITAYLMEKHPELMYRTSYRPSEHEKFTSTDAFKSYVEQFGPLLKHFSYNCYALEYKEGKIFGSNKTYYVKDTWFNNLSYVTDITKNLNYVFDNGITIQTHTSTKHYESESGVQYTKYLYAPEKAEDIGFQVYTAMAYGMKEINFFDYYQHWNDTNVTSGMVGASTYTADGKTANIGGTPNAVYTAVQTVNKQIDKFASVYQAFTWKDTVKIAAKNSGTVTTDKGRLSASVTGAETVIGHMVDVDGFDGYMIANAAGPRTSTAATVNLTFKEATKALVYDFSAGTKTEVTLNNGVTSVTVPVGGGVMVIPVK